MCIDEIGMYRMKKQSKMLMAMCLAGAVSVSGCHAVAELAGANTATLNAAAATGYNEMLQEARNEGKLDTSSRTYQRVQRVFQRMKPYADRMNATGQAFQWQLAVIKSDELNAFVAPGGKVVFYSGIVDQLNLTDDEIAAIMGHEMTHALEEHSKSKIGAQALTDLAVSVGASAAGLGNTGTALADLGSQLGIGLPYSRSLESRADAGGLRLMAAAGYNPNAAITLWNKMQAKAGNGVPTFLSTHPSSQGRITAMQKLMPEAVQIYQQSKAK